MSKSSKSYKSPIDEVCEKRHIAFYALSDKIMKYPNLSGAEARIFEEQYDAATRDLVTVLATIREHIRTQESRIADDMILVKFKMQMPKPSKGATSASATIMQQLTDHIDEANDDSGDIDASFAQLAEVLNFLPK